MFKSIQANDNNNNNKSRFFYKFVLGEKTIGANVLRLEGAFVRTEEELNCIVIQKLLGITSFLIQYI